MTSSLILASSSPRRRDILAALALPFEVRVAAVDETPRDGERAADMVQRLAVDKAVAVPLDATEIALAADTAVVLDDRIFGKPADEADAVEMLAQLSGRSHEVMTGVAVRHGDACRTALSVTEVRFRAISTAEARRYWQCGEPRGKAGAYAIQGVGGMFVEHIAGSYSGVVGLPVFETIRLLEGAGLDVLGENECATNP